MTTLLEDLRQQTDRLREQGLYKDERVLHGPQQAAVAVAEDREVINF